MTTDYTPSSYCVGTPHRRVEVITKVGNRLKGRCKHCRSLKYYPITYESDFNTALDCNPRVELAWRER